MKAQAVQIAAKLEREDAVGKAPRSTSEHAPRFAVAPEPPSSPTYEHQQSRIIRDLKAGTIPLELHEALKLVDPESREGSEFQKICERVARKLFTADVVVDGRDKRTERWRDLFVHDFDREPMRFVLSKLPEANAMCVAPASPPIIILNEGLFKPNKKTGEVPLQTEEDLMLVLGHEITHAKVKQFKSEESCSKPEEALCDVIPMRLLHYIGKDPAAILSFDARLRGSRGERATWGQLLDAHLTGPSRESLYEAALTELALSLGGVKESEGKRSPLPSGIEETIAGATHSSFLDGLKEASSYDSLSALERAEVLFSAMEHVGTDIPIRAREIAEEISRLGLTIDRKGDVQRIDRWLGALSSFHQSFKADPPGFPESPLDTLSAAYAALSTAAGYGAKVRPLGTALSAVAAAMRDVRDATESESFRELEFASKRLVRLYDQLPWAKGDPGHAFLRGISWPNFKLPDLERITRREKPERGEWEFLSENAVNRQEIAFAAVIMGLGADPRVRNAARSFLATPNLSSVTRVIEGGGTSSLAGISSGPYDREGNILAQCELTKTGRVVGHAFGAQAAFKVSATIDPIEMQRFISKEILDAERMATTSGSTLSIEQVKAMLLFEQVSPAQVLLDIMRSPGAHCRKEVLAALLEQSDFIVFHQMAIKLLGKHQSRATERNVLDLIRTLTEVKVSNPTLYRDVIDLLPSKIFQLYYHQRPLPGSIRHFVGATNLTSALSSFISHIAPDLTDQQLVAVLSGCGGDAVDIVPPQLKELCVARLGYPQEPTLLSLAEWLESGRGGSLASYLPDSSSGAVGAVGTSALASLCCQEFRRLVLAHPPKSIDIVTAARVADRLSDWIDGPTYFLKSTELSKRLSVFVDHGHSPDELAGAWRALYKTDLLTRPFEVSFLQQIISRCEKLPPCQARLDAVETLLKGSRIRQPELRDKVISMWVQDAAQELGADDQTAEFRTLLEKRLAPLLAEVSSIDLQEIGYQLAVSITSQRESSMLIEQLTQMDGLGGVLQLPRLGTEAEMILHVLRSHEKERNLFLKFLLGDGGKRATKEMSDVMYDLLRTSADKESSNYAPVDTALVVLYKEFWRLPLEGRAVYAKELLPTAARGSIDATFDYVVELVLPETMPYFAHTRDLLKRYVHALPAHAQHLALSALLTAGEPSTSDSATTPGAILAKFAESQGPAEIKFVQVLMDAPGLPDDFRRDLITNARHLKYKTQAPSRAQIFRLLDIIKERDGVSFGHIGDLVGCGSMNIVLKVDEGVLCLRRPNCQARAEDGFDIMLRMASSMDKDDPIALTIKPIVYDARERAALETNFLVAKQQYDRGASNYRGYVAVVDGTQIPLDSAEVFRAGEDFFTMSEMKGEHFVTRLEREGPTPELQRIARVILAREFNAIFRGNFDCDRHGGQIAIGESIGHFDFKAMALETWSDDDHRQLAQVLITTSMLCSTTSDIAPVMVSVLAQIREQGQAVSKLVTEAQKAILSLGDYFKALSPMPRETFLQLLVSGLSNEMPPHLQGLYADVCAEMVMPTLRHFSGALGALVPKKVISSLLRETFANGAPSPLLARVIPDAVRVLLPEASSLIRFERSET